ncbi:MAG: c-type cytochrome domain-containing protein, partial [Planctomycetota bacterium]
MSRFAPFAVLLACPLSLFAAEGDKKEPVLTYDEHVLPLLRAKCTGCHNADRQEGGLNLSQYAALMQGGGSGEA